jgi:hypothetical protein
MSSDYAPACERNVKENVSRKKIKKYLYKRWNSQWRGSLLPRHGNYLLIGTLGKNLAFSPRGTLATLVRIDLIGSSPKSDR